MSKSKQEKIEEAANFLAMFPVFDGSSPLKVGIHKDVFLLRDQLGLDIRNRAIRYAIWGITTSYKYKFADGTPRKDLHGNECGLYKNPIKGE